MDKSAKKLGALLAAHKSKKAHEEHLRQQERAAMSKARPNGAKMAMKRNSKCKMKHGDDMNHTYD
jgi:hypothetical protein